MNSTKPRFIATLMMMCATFSAAADLGLAFVNDLWDGKTIPAGQQCRKFGGTGGTPALRVSSIPPDANALVMEFSDRTYTPMDQGGHGKLGYRIEAGTAETIIPTVPPHTTDLPEGFWTVAPHGAPGWDTAGAYLPPCSGGKGNEYYVTVKAVTKEDDRLRVITEAVLEMGTY